MLLLVCELLLQVLLPILFRPRFSRVDAELGWAHNSSVSGTQQMEGREHTLSYNSHGFRPPEHAYAPPSGLKRVLVLGDSFVDGSEVDDEETFTWHLQRCLPDVEVVNMGVYGYSTAQELLLLEREGLRYRPDLIILLTVTNDYIGNVMALESFGPAPRFLLDGSGLRFEGTRASAAQRAFLNTNLPVPRFIHEHSLVYYLLNHYLYQPRIADRIEQVRQERAAIHGESDRIVLYRRLVERIGRRALESDSEFWVVLSYLATELGREGESPHSAARAVLESDGHTVLDLLPALKARQDSGKPSLYFQEDIHWNTMGHAFVADLLSPQIDAWIAGEPPDAEPRRLADCARVVGQP